MAPSLEQLGIDKLSVEDRISLVEAIMETIPEEEGVPEWHLELVRERIAYSDAHPEDRIPWKKAFEDLRNDR